jgi:Tfp pilus assembly protein PilW
LFVSAILAFLVGALFTVLSAGQNAWYTADVSVGLQQDLRNCLMRLTKELRESGFKCNNPPDCTNTTVQVTILPGSGTNKILRFKVPVDYNQDGYIKNSSGIVEVWGADLTWGCVDFSCQRPLSPELQNTNYQIEYLVDDSGHLLRRVLDSGLSPIRTDIYARNVVNFNVTRNGNLVTIELSERKISVLRQEINASLSAQVSLRNRG